MRAIGPLAVALAGAALLGARSLHPPATPAIEDAGRLLAAAAALDARARPVAAIAPACRAATISPATGSVACARAQWAYHILRGPGRTTLGRAAFLRGIAGLRNRAVQLAGEPPAELSVLTGLAMAELALLSPDASQARLWLDFAGRAAQDAASAPDGAAPAADVEMLLGRIAATRYALTREASSGREALVRLERAAYGDGASSRAGYFYALQLRRAGHAERSLREARRLLARTPPGAPYDPYVVLARKLTKDLDAAAD